MRIAFMGTPDFAAASLRRLFDDGHDVACVFTQPDKPAGRGKKLTPPPVKTLADGRTEVYQPDFLRGDAEKYLRGKNVDLVAVVAYGKLLPPELLAIPPLGCVNIHASLLPKYRGAAPVQRAILAGEQVTGVTSMFMAEGLDTGDIILAKSVKIDTDTSGVLLSRLAKLGAELLSETVLRIADGTAPRVPQNEAEATYAPPLRKEEAPIDWAKPARDIICHIRGMNPWPVASAELNGAAFKVFAVCTADGGGEPGAVLRADNAGLTVACGDGAVTILELQAAGGRRMSAAEYLRGHPIL